VLSLSTFRRKTGPVSVKKLTFRNAMAPTARLAAIAADAIIAIRRVPPIIVAVAGLAFGNLAARGALTGKMRTPCAPGGGIPTKRYWRASNRRAGRPATVIGRVSSIVTASGVFGDMQAARNAIRCG
jgi:membrane protein